MKRTSTILLFACLLALPNLLWAEITLPQAISSNMVFQRNKEIIVWGWADKKENIKVEFAELSRKTRAGSDGKWMVTFPAMTAGGPYQMVISGKNQIGLENIMIGDVWICSGQSNMEWSVSNSNNAEEEIMNANYPNIRLLDVGRNFQLAPVDDIPATNWNVCSSSSIPSFSAVGYFFGRFVHKEVGVPIGLISTNWGGTNIEAWTSMEFISTHPDFTEKIEKIKALDPEKAEQEKKVVLENLMKDFGVDPKNPAKEDWSAMDVDYSLWKEAEVPGLWESRELTGIDGVVWYRKEIELPSEVAGKGLVLNLGKIDDGDITYVNGVEVGRTENSYDAERTYKVDPEILVAGKNVIAVKVFDFGGGGGFWSGPKAITATSGDFEMNLSGTWKYKLTGENLNYSFEVYTPNQVPSSLYNGMIHPLLNLSVKGAIWYQGESNANRAYQYRDLMPLMIECWRENWEQPEMPFFMVQLANFKEARDEPGDSDWAELREAQLLTLDKLENTGMAVIIDIGEADDIHPRNKQDVGYRLGLNALKIAYGRDVVHQGPVYESVGFRDGKAYLDFSSTGSGLMIKDKYGYLKGFAIAGEDRKFHWAKAKIEGNKVVVYSEKVKEPVAVRYAWADNPEDANLYNKEGLPAGPFRTDQWPGITEGVR